MNHLQPRFSALLAALAVIAAHFCCVQTQAQHKGHAAGTSTSANADKPSTHGMLIFGTPQKDGTIYASHLPLFRSPHDYQIILEIALDAKATLMYRKSLKNFRQQKVYTIEPEPFVLPEMITSPRSFKARLFRGHFERDGKPLGDTATVNIKRVLYFKKFDPAAQHSEAAQYLVFGNSSKERSHEYFAAHVISAKPDFDHICELGVDKKTAASLEKLCEHSCGIIETDNKANTELKRSGFVKFVKSTSSSEAGTTPSGKAGSSLKLTMVRELYLERDDLR
jgi:hypothetical protein